MEEIVVKAVKDNKRCYADGGWDWLETHGGEHGITGAVHFAEEFPEGEAAKWLSTRNERIARYTKQAETGPIHFERR